MKKTEKVRRFLEKGLSVNEIAKKLKVTPNYVYTLRWLDKKKGVNPSAKKFKKSSKIAKTVKEIDQHLKNLNLPKRDKKAEAWAKKNPWFGVDEKKTAFALVLHQELVDEGIDPKSDLYYEEIDVAMKNEFSPDLVNHPPHYKSGGIETLDFIEAKDLNFRLGNVVKYVSRAGKKPDSDPIKDLEKAAFYLKREIDARKRA